MKIHEFQTQNQIKNPKEISFQYMAMNIVAYSSSNEYSLVRGHVTIKATTTPQIGIEHKYLEFRNVFMQRRTISFHISFTFPIFARFMDVLFFVLFTGLTRTMLIKVC